ncbi:hypothetical protein Sjap_025353 [Stephania japonica]|uniref:Chlororespiratory reduction 4 n=1 Tax=Stephania japonica TaxID=461633 RepID=A0AAP0HHG7_9MAGN
MTLPSRTNLVLKNPLLSLLQRSKSTSQILQIHAQLITNSLISDAFSVSRLVAALTSNALNMSYAETLFAQIPNPHTFIWNSMIRGYVQSLNFGEAFRVFDRMRKSGAVGDNHSYTFVVKACGLMMGVEEGREVHGEVVKRGYDEDLFVRNCLVGMYCRFGELRLARRVFDGFCERDLVSWNTMINGYVGVGEMGKARKLFDEMPERDVVSWTMMIEGYGKKVGCVSQARELFNEMPERDIVAWNSMIDVYAGVGDMDNAHELFRLMHERNVITWSIMIDRNVRHGNSKAALDLFIEMLLEGVIPDKVSVVGAIQACAQLGALDQGRWIHIYMEKNKIATDVVVQTALVDMYMKCGCVDEASALFDGMSERSVVSWNVMIVGLGINSSGESALKLFHQMEALGVVMDDLTFLGILSACNHSGLVTEGLQIFDKMRHSYGIEPKEEHYSCLVDLLGRAGQLHKIQDIIATQLPDHSNAALWGSLLAAYRTHRNLSLAEAFSERLLEVKADDSGAFVLLSNIYAEEGRWEDVLNTRKVLYDRGMVKEIGTSVIEVDAGVHEFFNNDRSHCLIEEIRSVIWNLSKTVVSAL